MDVMDGYEERRIATPIGNTANVPSGTLVTVPSAPVSGPLGAAPVVAVNVISRWRSRIMWVSVVALPALTWLYTWLTSAGVLAFAHHPAMFATGVTFLGLFIGYLRTSSNTVIR
jgi:hypothetical protein